MTTWDVNPITDLPLVTIYEALSQIPTYVRVLPSFLMLVAVSKAFLGFLLEIFAFVGVMIAGWKVLEKKESFEDILKADSRNGERPTSVL